MKLNQLQILAATALLAIGATQMTRAQEDNVPPIEAREVADRVYMLSGGEGANSSVLLGDDGALLVDSKLDEASARAMRSTIEEMDGGEVRYLINSHVHPDHTGGNVVFGDTGALIIGHQEVRSILAEGQRGGPPAPAAALPELTFGENGGTTLHVNGEAVNVMHMPPAHTADNSIVHFQQANVFHLGDIYSPSRYPVIAGGTLQGYIDAVDRVLALSDGGSRFIPGVGNVVGRDAIIEYREMLSTVLERVSRLVEEGNSLEEVSAAEPTMEYDDTWGEPDHPLFLPVVYRQLAGE